MSVTYTPIYTQTVGSGGASQIIFNNIPQTHTDLKLVISARTSGTGPGSVVALQFGTLGGIDSGTNYSRTFLQGYGSGAFSGRNSTQSSISLDQVSGNGTTANSFGSAELTVPSYTQNSFKSVLGDLVWENNSTTDNNIVAMAGLWRNTNAITSIRLSLSENFLQNSTFSLYGVTRFGA